MSRPVQQALDLKLPRRRALGREDFIVAPSNARALAMIEAWPDWPEGALLLLGPAGAGKTHLAHVWIATSGAERVSSGALDARDAPELAAIGAAVVEDVDRIGGDLAAGRALFHLMNLMRAEGGAILLTGTGAPKFWGATPPDLASRLLAAPAAALEPPDAALLAGLLDKHFADRRLNVAPRARAFIVARMERTADAAGRIAARLDEVSYAERRNIGVPLCKELFGW